jgi:hypothetical protein
LQLVLQRQLQSPYWSVYSILGIQSNNVTKG